MSSLPVWPRILAKTEWQGDCLVWTGARNEDGYGNLSINGVIYRVHRFIAALAGLDIEGREVMHRCDNPPCCNPEHLTVGSHQDNMLDAGAKGRMARVPHRLVRTHCPQGHPYAGENLYINPQGCRRCRECARRSRAKAAAKAKS